ncbi:ABC transporter ATP-binding protein [Enterococcus durans]|uniref:ABC transporter ATP-binding protein n=1 Tax=Enterococcus durans TaxID=53345 RepID=UPI001AD7F78A|nr:ABC transporter ATP-binding protein [Enterococcus durans]
MKDILTMKNIVKKFGKGHTEVTALKDINFTVKQGEFVSIIGPSGSGKSTFLTISGGLQNPTSGEITINGQSFLNLSEKKRADLRFKEIGFILQSSNLIPFLKVKEQFYLVDKVSHQKKAETTTDELLKSLDIYELKDSYPKDLSGGERQRVAIARALFNDPSLILADEPTASLDTDHAYEVVKLLVKEAYEKQKATVMVTHDARMIKWSDRVYRMKDGYLVEEDMADIK